MTELSTILASGDDGIGRVVGLIVLAAFMIIGSVVKGAAKAREEKEAQEREAARRRRLAALPAPRQGPDEPPPIRPPVLTKAARHAAALAAAAKAQLAAKRHARREDLGEGVQEELAGFALHDEQTQAAQQERMHLSHSETAATESQANLSVFLPGRATIGLHGSAVAQAIILREILSPPKALRRDEEMWEM